MADAIELRGLRLVGTHGVLPEERTRAQPFEVDVDIVCDLTAAGRSDELDDTLDYGAIVAAVAGVVQGESHRLLERVAQRITEVVLADTRVASVTVAVRKLRPPLPHDLAVSGVRITRP